MQLRQPFPLWISLSLFAVSVSVIPLAARLLRRPTSVPNTLTELTMRLSRRTPPLHVIPQFEARPGGPLWVCARPQSREQLLQLARDPQDVKAGHWHGIVFCERLGERAPIPDEFIRDNWGEYGMLVGPFVFFGDPDLLQCIREAILDP